MLLLPNWFSSEIWGIIQKRGGGQICNKSSAWLIGGQIYKHARNWNVSKYWISSKIVDKYSKYCQRDQNCPYSRKTILIIRSLHNGGRIRCITIGNDHWSNPAIAYVSNSGAIDSSAIKQMCRRPVPNMTNITNRFGSTVFNRMREFGPFFKFLSLLPLTNYYREKIVLPKKLKVL